MPRAARAQRGGAHAAPRRGRRGPLVARGASREVVARFAGALPGRAVRLEPPGLAPLDGLLVDAQLVEWREAERLEA
ncbi:hypothetical protein CF642_38850, partial [Burkholderia pseudomallei]